MNDSEVIFQFLYQNDFLFIPKKELIIEYRILNYNLMGLTILSLYFSKFPFLFRVLNYCEIESILNEKSESDNLLDDYMKLSPHLLALKEKLEKEKLSILDETIHLKYIQTFLIKFIKKISKKLFDFDEFSKYPAMVKSFEDFDFCLKYFFFRMYGIYKFDIYSARCKGSLDNCDKRIPIFYIYNGFKLYEKQMLKIISKEEMKTINQTLIIQNIIIVGDEDFHKTIKNIESFFIPETKKTIYLSMNEVRNFLEKENSFYKIRDFSYIIIIKTLENNSYFKELYSLRDELCLDIMLITYNENKNILINKKILMELTSIPVFISNNFSEIINFIISQKYCNCGRCFLDFSSMLRQILHENKIMNKFFPIIKFEENENIDKLNAEDGWELVDSVPKELFNMKFLAVEGRQNLDSIRFNLFKLYRENKIESVFFNKYCKFFNFHLLPDILCSKNISIALKQICFAYTLADKKAFYYIMNKDLRSGNLSKIEKFLNLVSAFNFAIEQKYIKSYEGELYRGTKLDKDFIENKLIIGKSLTNLCFWSASKSREIAENFLKGKNILFLIKSRGKNNIDIDLQKSSFFDEKEVLILPYCKFLVKSKEKKIFMNNEIYEVQIEEIDEVNERKNIKSYNTSMEESYLFCGLPFKKK